MRLTPALSAGSRHRTVGVSLALLVTGFALTLGAGTPAGSEPGQQATPPPTRVYNLGAAMILHNIKPDKTADFEMVMGKVKVALQKSEDPIRKQQAASWKLYKAAEPGAVMRFYRNPEVKEVEL